MARNAVLLGIAALAVYGLYRLYTLIFRRTYLKALPGPPNAHPFFGNMREIFKTENSFMHGQWAENYGPVIAYRELLSVGLAIFIPYVRN
jgi:hypothetical protein